MNSQFSATHFGPPVTGRLTIYQRGYILALWDYGFSFADISRATGRDQSTVTKFIKRVLDTGEIESTPIPGRPRIATAQDIRHIVRSALEDRQQHWKDLKRFAAPNLSITTIKRILREQHIKKWKAKYWPNLEEKYTYQRLRFVLQYRDWVPDVWFRVM